MNVICSLILGVTSTALFAVNVHGAQPPVNLGSAENFVILSKTGISTTGTTSIVGDIGVSPIDSTGITGFSLIVDSTTQFATTPLVTGKVYASDYSAPTPANMTVAVADMETAFTDAAGRTLPDTTELGAGNISGMTIPPGLHKWGSGVLFTSGVTFSGGPNEIWILQIAGDLTVEDSAIVALSGGAQAANIFWQVAGEAVIKSGAQFSGILLSQTAIHLRTGASFNGRLLAQTAVTLQANAVTAPTAVSLKFTSISRATNGVVSLVLLNTPDEGLTLQYSTNLTSWTTLSTTTPTVSPYETTHNTLPGEAKGFYRAFYP